MKHALLIIFLLLIACQPTKIDNIRYETGALSNITQHMTYVPRLMGKVMISVRVPDGFEFDFHSQRYRIQAPMLSTGQAQMQIAEFNNGYREYILLSVNGVRVQKQCWRCPQ